tara:strand:+ start:645 stop:1787 length:1143 start_codon:yes stop_codon:yes gene_type:complete
VRLRDASSDERALERKLIVAPERRVDARRRREIRHVAVQRPPHEIPDVHGLLQPRAREVGDRERDARVKVRRDELAEGELAASFSFRARRRRVVGVGGGGGGGGGGGFVRRVSVVIVVVVVDALLLNLRSLRLRLRLRLRPQLHVRGLPERLRVVEVELHDAARADVREPKRRGDDGRLRRATERRMQRDALLVQELAHAVAVRLELLSRRRRRRRRRRRGGGLPRRREEGRARIDRALLRANLPAADAAPRAADRLDRRVVVLRLAHDVLRLRAASQAHVEALVRLVERLAAADDADENHVGGGRGTASFERFRSPRRAAPPLFRLQRSRARASAAATTPAARPSSRGADDLRVDTARDEDAARVASERRRREDERRSA